MAGQRAGVPAGEARARADVPGPRRGQRGRGTEPRDPGRAAVDRSGGRAAVRARNRRAGQQTRAAAPTRGGPALLAVGLPLLGALADELTGSTPGWIFGVLTVLGTAGAALLSGRDGWWWVLTAPPPVVLLCTAVTELLAHSSKYRSSEALATGAARWAIHGFPVMVAAVLAAAAAVLVRVAREGRERGGRRG
ncbi:DUF6542 domain-containing protein [Kitasatospora sp. NPDC052896]|uniref:DUF6542 domain-containing protein n=1 Tax=Kitasatospora sp. NPDC052896 TaxID=3364061 RepID=UPI0037C905C6